LHGDWKISTAPMGWHQQVSSRQRKTLASLLPVRRTSGPPSSYLPRFTLTG